MIEGKELPHDLLAEKSLLGCMIFNSQAIDEISELKLEKPDFYHPQYAVIFESIMDIFNSSRPVDYVTLCSSLAEKGKLELVGGQAAILNIVEEQASSANIYHYGKIVKDKANLREMIKTAGRMADKGMKFSGNIDDFILEKGMTLALEPMINMGTYMVKIAPDNWTFITVDSKWSAHFEDTVVITENGAEVVTKA